MNFARMFLIGVTIFAFSPIVNAARYKAHNYIYFDENGTPIGQVATYCNGVRWEGGSTGRIFLRIETGCGAVEVCPIEKDTCHVAVDGVITVSLAGTSNFTRAEACQMIGEFPCIAPAPEILFTYGWNPVRTR